MKLQKKVMGLLLAGVMAVPMTGVYANTHSIDDVNPVATGVIQVNGSIESEDGKSSKIEVTMPTSLAFTVDKDGDFILNKNNVYTVDNTKSPEGIEITISKFDIGSATNNVAANGGITVEEYFSFNSANAKRTHIGLAIKGFADSQTVYAQLMPGQDTVIYSASKQPLGTNQPILVVESGQSADFTLVGTAGDKKIGDVCNCIAGNATGANPLDDCDGSGNDCYTAAEKEVAQNAGECSFDITYKITKKS